MEGLDIINVPENGLFLARDVRRCIGTVSVPPVVGGKEIHLFNEL